MNFTFDLTVTIGLIASLVMGLVGWFRMRHTAIDRRIDSAGARIDRHEQRILTMEQIMAGLPGKDDMHSLQLALSDLRGEMREMRASASGQNAILSRLDNVVARQEDHLLRNSG